MTKITIRKLNKNDDLSNVANLIYNTGLIFPLFFGKKQKAIRKIKKLVSMENNSFSYKNIAVYEDNGIKGIILYYSKINLKKEYHEFKKIYSFLELIKFHIALAIIFPLIKFNYRDGIYIQNICVNQTLRGKGIGTKLIEYVNSESKNKSIKYLYLDVSIENNKAKKFYDKKNFSIVKKRKILGFFPAAYLMKKEIDF